MRNNGNLPEARADTALGFLHCAFAIAHGAVGTLVVAGFKPARAWHPLIRRCVLTICSLRLITAILL